MIEEAIILAGGLGTRLRSVIADTPKCMAPVAGKPFLHFVIDFLQKSGIRHYIFSVGYLHEIIEEYLVNKYPRLDYTISFEDEPMGTGGAIKLACRKTMNENALVLNGDTLYKIECDQLSRLHEQVHAQCTLCLKPMKSFDRYGVVELNDDHSIKSFKEKKYYDSGLINGGVYALNTAAFLQENLPEKFSFEKDYLEKIISMQTNQRTDEPVPKPKLYGMIQDEYFIDIGIPEDYNRAQVELA